MHFHNVDLKFYKFFNTRVLQLQERLIQTSRLTRLDSKVSKWKDSVENQRRNVYNDHSILS